ncbi:acyl-CoA carboxylase epsilon subunit [Actinotalea sp. JY-7876]|uniref:acyl-CoA carboxylase epsilon subunit n=1 Tax=Actinotalea sp. JY-7876 TaxID=2758442 RepID=UPI0015F443F2|nr:acyl-CoA carboxylase epsilon subunit [Actinotalea sp. JY-7876]
MSAEVRVVRGEPDDAELAALVAGLAATAGTPVAPAVTAPAAAGEADAVRRWRAAAAFGAPRIPLAPGTDAWRWSGRS